MANFRIRYRDTNTRHVVESSSVLRSESTNARYKVVINNLDTTYFIQNLNTGRRYMGSGSINNEKVLKRYIRKHLRKLGVCLSSEVRDNSDRIKGVNCNYAYPIKG